MVKLAVVIALGFNIMHPLNQISSWGMALLIALFLVLNNHTATALKGIVGYGITSALPSLDTASALPVVLQIPIGVLLMANMFYLPLFAGVFFVKTADVGGVLSSLDKIHAPLAVSIPVAIMFRYFPAFSEERKHVRRAMNIRGINLLNPLQYLEYVSVPLLIISSNIADDIAKAAETKGIENPVEKTRYVSATLGLVDAGFGGLSALLMIGGWIW
nr:energy-coupling factor transporter transmembrane component T [Collinsella urealyticum]